MNDLAPGTATSLPEAANAIAGSRPEGSALRICSSAVAILGAESFAAFSAPATRMINRSWNV